MRVGTDRQKHLSCPKQKIRLQPVKRRLASLLDESFSAEAPLEGNVARGQVTAIENDLAIIDVGLKTEGRVPLREFSMAGQEPTISVADGEVSRPDRKRDGRRFCPHERARESWVKLEKS